MKTENSNDIREMTDAELDNVGGGTLTEGLITATLLGVGSLVNPVYGLTAAYAYGLSKLI